MIKRKDGLGKKWTVREIEHDRDIVALIIRDILKDRNYHLIEYYSKQDWYQQELNEYIKHGILLENVPIDLVFFKCLSAILIYSL
jgi:hypothetical protein